MTSSTFDVAVCCSSNSAQTLAQEPRIFDRYHRLGGEFLTSSICLSVKGRTSCRATANAPISLSSFSIGTPRTVLTRQVRRPQRTLASVFLCAPALPQIGGVNQLFGRDVRPKSVSVGAGNAVNGLGFGERWWQIMHGHELQSVALPAMDGPHLASQMRTAFSSMVANTGCRSPGELEMTWSTSDVAVCCSSASVSSTVRSVRSVVRWRSSLSNRAFSMAITAWAAKFLTSSICFSVKGRTSWRESSESSDQFVVV